MYDTGGWGVCVLKKPECFLVFLILSIIMDTSASYPSDETSGLCSRAWVHISLGHTERGRVGGMGGAGRGEVLIFCAPHHDADMSGAPRFQCPSSSALLHCTEISATKTKKPCRSGRSHLLSPQRQQPAVLSVDSID